MQDLKHIDKELAKLAQVRYRYDIINPINRQEEEKKFFVAKSKYNPQFTYNHYNVKPLIEELLALHIETNTSMGKLFEEVREDLLEEARALDNIGTDNFIVKKMFGALSNEELEEVNKTLERGLKNRQPKEEDTSQLFPATELGKRIETVLKHYKLDDWNIVYSELALARTSVTKDTKTITIKADELFTNKDMQKLIVHEIETHVLRWHNGTKQPYNIFNIGIRDYLTVEEGMAEYNEAMQGVGITNPKFSSAILALATHLGKTKGFADIYQTIRPYVGSDEIGFQMVTRVKRGLGDTSKPGGYLKDHAYFRGYLQIREFVKSGGKVKDLYAGKITINNLHLLKEGILEQPELLPEFLK